MGARDHPRMLDPATIAKLLDGSPRDRDRLASMLMPMVERQVFFTLRATAHTRPNPSAAMARHEDYVQDVLASLFNHDGRDLRAWKPEKASLHGYLGMVAGRYIRRQLRRPGMSSAIAELDGDVHCVVFEPMDRELAYQAALEELLEWVDDECSDKDRQRFAAMFVEQRSTAEGAAEEGTTTDAVYTWVSRFRRRVHEALPHLAELLDWHDDDPTRGSKGTP